MSDPTNEPTTFRAGDSVTWSRHLPDYLPSAGWALKYRLLWPTGTAVAINASADGEDHKVTLTSANTANWAAGTATLVAWAEHADGSRATLEQQTVSILPDLTTAANFDSRTQNQKALADARTALAAYAAKGQIHVAEYDIAGRRMKFRTTDEITKLINFYEGEVTRERTLQAIAEGGSPGRVRVRF
jgi:hypothetical protein